MERVDYQSVVIQDLYNIERSGDLNLRPWYQRRPVWTPAQRAYLINTIASNMPVPSIYIRHHLDIDAGKTIKEVVDGQQRLRSIFSFLDDEFVAKIPGYSRRMRFSKLEKSDQARIRMTSLSVGYLIGATDSDVIDIFGRINWISKNLNDQEKRNAGFFGEFKQATLRYSSEKVGFWRDLRIFSETNIARMAEVQFVSDLAMNLDLGLQDFSQKRLTDYYARHEEEYPQWQNIKKRLDWCFDRIGQLPPDLVRTGDVARTPIMFSLVIAMDEKRPSIKKLVSVVEKVNDVLSQSDVSSGLSKGQREFVEASKSSTQRIRTRTIRHKFITSLM